MLARHDKDERAASSDWFLPPHPACADEAALAFVVC